jgi:hypothetical protein
MWTVRKAIALHVPMAAPLSKDDTITIESWHRW